MNRPQTGDTIYDPGGDIVGTVASVVDFVPNLRKPRSALGRKSRWLVIDSDGDSLYIVEYTVQTPSIHGERGWQVEPG